MNNETGSEGVPPMTSPTRSEEDMESCPMCGALPIDQVVSVDRQAEPVSNRYTLPPSDPVRAAATCECATCGRMHRPLGRPPWALSSDDLQHLSRSFKTDYRTTQDIRINEWLKRMIAAAILSRAEE